MNGYFWVEFGGGFYEVGHWGLILGIAVKKTRRRQ